MIRLRGPWTTEDGRRVKLPSIWREALGEADSTVLSRTFNRPTNLDEGSGVLVHIESQHAVAAVRLNDAPLELCNDRAEISGLLQGSNVLAVGDFVAKGWFGGLVPGGRAIQNSGSLLPFPTTLPADFFHA